MRNASRILFISHGNTFNGAELCLAESVKALKDLGGGDVHVLLERGGDYLKSLLVAYGAIVHDGRRNPRWIGGELSWLKKCKLMVRSIQALVESLKLIRRVRPDIVISNSIVCSPAAALAARLSRVKHVWYVHELGDADHGYKFYLGKALTWRLVQKLSWKIIFNSEFTRSHFVGAHPDKTVRQRVIYYGVPIDRLKAHDPNFEREVAEKWVEIPVWRILVSGRTAPGKGQLDIVRAAAVIKNKHGIDNFFLTILGRVKGTYAEELEQLIEEESLRKHVEVIPFVQNPGSYYARAHIGVTTSRHEAFGRVTVEYMKSNMVVVGANAGGTKEILDACGVGGLYPVGDFNKLAEVLIRIMTSPSAGQDRATKAQLAANALFSLPRHAEDLSGYFELGYL